MEVGPAHGLPEPSVIACDALVSVPLSLFDSKPVGRLDVATRAELDAALRYALNILY